MTNTNARIDDRKVILRTKYVAFHGSLGFTGFPRNSHSLLHSGYHSNPLRAHMGNPVEYRSVAAADLELLQRFLSELGWADRVADPKRSRRMIENADRTVLAVENHRIVGF